MVGENSDYIKMKWKKVTELLSIMTITKTCLWSELYWQRSRHCGNNCLLSSLELVGKKSMVNPTRDAISGNDGNTDITVAINGTWQKSGPTSLHGVITATSLNSVNVIDVECLSKYCSTC